MPWEQLDELLARADIVLSTTGAPEPIVTLERYRRIAARRTGGPLVILDIAVPRDFDPRIHDGDRTCLFNIDDLQAHPRGDAGRPPQARRPGRGDRRAGGAALPEATGRRRRNGPVIARLTQDLEAKRQEMVQQPVRPAQRPADRRGPQVHRGRLRAAAEPVPARPHQRPDRRNRGRPGRPHPAGCPAQAVPLAGVKLSSLAGVLARRALRRTHPPPSCEHAWSPAAQASSAATSSRRCWRRAGASWSSTTCPPARPPIWRPSATTRICVVVIDSVANADLLGGLLDEADEVYHLAAVVGVRLVLDEPERTVTTNLGPTEMLLRLLRRPAEAAVPGQHQRGLRQEPQDAAGARTTTWCSARPRAAAGSTRAARRSTNTWPWPQHERTGLPVVVGRFFNVVGPRQVGRYGMVLPRFVDQALAGGPLVVHDDGQQVRCFAHVADVVAGVLQLMACPARRGRVFNLGSDEPVTIRALAETVAPPGQSRGRPSSTSLTTRRSRPASRTSAAGCPTCRGCAN